jgi:acyl-CoA synthetase (NDP forming)
MGAISRPGGYDLFFIPPTRMDKRWQAPARRVAFLSQSGAFLASRMSNIETLDPAFAVSLGNQADVTISDVVAAVGKRDDIDTIGIYMEGFANLDGLELVRRISGAVEAGKEVVFYKAGRTEPGRSAAAGHTASIAGDYDVCQAAVEHAGGMFAETFREFEQLLELSAALHGRKVAGVRLGLITNAGYEAVGMADNIHDGSRDLEVTELSDASLKALSAVLEEGGLGRIVNARNPLDLTPMASEEVYEGAVRAMLESDAVDAVVVSAVPLTAALKTAADELDDPGSLANLLPRLFAGTDKPVVAVIDAGARYEPLVRALRLGGMPVFRSADQAMRSLRRYLGHRVARAGTG